MGAYLCKNFGIVVVRDLCATVSEMKRPHCKGHVTACTMARARFAGSPDCAIENVSIRRCEHLHAASTHVEDSGSDKNCHGCARSGHILMNCAKSYLRRNRVASSAQRPLDGGGACQFASNGCGRHTPGVAIPPAAKFTTGSLFSLAVSFNRWNGA